MLSIDIVTCIRESIDALMTPRNRETVTKVQQLLLPAHRDGALADNAISGRRQIGTDELEHRASLIWQQIMRCHELYGSVVDQQTVVDLQQRLAEHIAAQCTAVLTAIDQPIVGHIPPSVKADIRATVLTRRKELIDYYNNESRLYIEQLRRPPATLPSGVHIYGPVGAVMTGANATAHVHMDAAGRDRFVEALEALREAIGRIPELTVDQRTESRDVIAELTTEANAQRPNTMRIRGLLAGLSTGIQTAASARGAWEQLRDAAMAIGAWFQ
ncbi:MAG: hypothetical protein ACLQFF_12510 [Steroidobacteraceae bacterium]|jgi:hypothetical protein